MKFLIFVLILTACNRSNQSFRGITGVVVAGWEDVKLSETASYEVAGHQVVEFAAKNQNTEAKVRVLKHVSSAAAKRLREQKLFSIETLYRERRNPYAGSISKSIGKHNSPGPQINVENSENMDMTRIRVPVNARKSFVLGRSAETHFQHLWLMIYCKQSQAVVQIEAYMAEAKAKMTDLDKWLVPSRCL